MWIHSEKGFLSIVEFIGSPDNLLVRARYDGDIERIFGEDTYVMAGAGSDYEFRAVVPREQVSAVIHRMVDEISYPNFKDRMENVHRRQHSDYLGSIHPAIKPSTDMVDVKQGALHRVWEVMFQAQQEADACIDWTNVVETSE